VVAIIDSLSGYSGLMFDGYKLLNGSAYDGKYDKWLGSNRNASEDELAFVNYAQLVLESDVAVAIKSVQSPNEHLTVDEIRKLRNEATVKCSKCHNPCDLKQQQCVFYVVDDPCEQNNIIDSMDPAVLSYLRSRLVPNCASNQK